MRCMLGLLTLTIITCAVAPRLHADTYVAHALNVPAGDSGTAYDVNDSGQVVGTTYGDSGDCAVIWSGQTSDPVTIRCVASPGVAYARFITGSGLVVGENFENSTLSTYSWTSTGGLSDTWANYTLAGVNDNGEAVAGGGTCVVALDSNGNATTLTNPFGATMCQASGINDSGCIVGEALDPEGNYEALLWQPGDSDATVLGTFGAQWSEAVAINDSGTVLGMYRVPAEVPRAFSCEVKLAARSSFRSAPSWTGTWGSVHGHQ